MKHYNPILHGSSRAWAEQGRHYIGGGIGEAALIGAAVGGGTALITGEDPLQGALTGGVLGGAGGALFGTGAQGAKTATEVATKAPSVAGAVGQGVNLSNAASPLFYSGAGTGVGTGISSGVGSGITAAAQGVGQAVPSAVAQGLYPNFAVAGQGAASTAAGLTDDVIAAAGKDVAQGIAGAPQMANAAQPGMFDKLGGWYSGLSTPEKIGVGIAGGVGLNALTGQRPTVPKLDDSYDGPLSRFKYDPDKFSPTRVTSNVYRPSYAAKGGVMNSYAQGGIAALANGGMGNNSGYPMGQMDMTQYATPSQMPTSAEVVNAGYEVATNPYTGSPVKMAEGGYASYNIDKESLGGKMFGETGVIDQLPQSVISEILSDPGMSQFMGFRQINTPRTYSVTAPNTGRDFNISSPTARSEIYNPIYDTNNYVNRLPTDNTNPTTPSNFIDAYNLLAATSPSIAATISPQTLGSVSSAKGMAEGGDTSSDGSSNYSLGDSLGLLQATNPGIAALYTNPAPTQPVQQAPVQQAPAPAPAPAPVQQAPTPAEIKYANDIERLYAQNANYFDGVNTPNAYMNQYRDPYQNYIYSNMSSSPGAEDKIAYALEQYRAAGNTDTPQWAKINPRSFNDLPSVSWNWDASGGLPIDDFTRAWSGSANLSNPAPQGYFENIALYNMGLSPYRPDLAVNYWNRVDNTVENRYDPAEFERLNKLGLEAMRSGKSLNPTYIPYALDPHRGAGYDSYFYDDPLNISYEQTHPAGTGFMTFNDSGFYDYIDDNQGMAKGGIAGYNLGGYASGGNPRLLKGPGDGMSDNIPATIGDRQPARLADGEFVVPADVVSHLGNGSTDAGAKHLYSMMDKVRKARTGKKRQGKQIKPEKFLPA
jgi:hypothetical protein